MYMQIQLHANRAVEGDAIGSLGCGNHANRPRQRTLLAPLKQLKLSIYIYVNRPIHIYSP